MGERISIALLAVCLPVGVLASDRTLVFTEQLDPLPHGAFEIEQTVEYQRNSDSDRVDLRERLGWGAAADVRLSLFVPNWHYEDEGDEVEVDSVGGQVLWYAADPAEKPWGWGLLGEVNAGDGEQSGEGRLLVQKDADDFSFTYNLALRASSRERTNRHDLLGEIGHLLGISYAFTPQFNAGLEMTIVSAYEEMRRYESTTVYAGPVVGFRGEEIVGTNAKWWITLTPAFQLSDVEEEPEYKLGMLFGVEF